MPLEGGWSYVDFATAANTCPPFINPEQLAGDFGISSANSTGFHVIPNDGTAELDCTLSSSAFNCPNRVALDKNTDTTFVTGTVSVQGTFSSASAATGSQAAHVTCTGPGCAAIGLGDACDFTANFTVHAL